MLKTLRQRTPAPTRADLETAANAFFQRLLQQEDGERESRDLDAPDFERVAAENQVEYDQRLRELERQFRQNVFDRRVEFHAQRIVRDAGGKFEDLDESSQRYALQLSARVSLELTRFLIHVHASPGAPFPAQRIVGVLPASALAVYGAEASADSTFEAPSRTNDGQRTVADAVRLYLDHKKRQRLGTSQLEEIGRAFDWLQEHLGPQAELDGITQTKIRAFRDGLERLDVRWRGKTRPFADRQTSDPSHQVQPQTARRYWRYVVGLLDWCVAEGHASSNPAKGMTTISKMGVKKRTPPPFTNEEVCCLLRTPLYAGHKSANFLLEDGGALSKGSYYWCGLIALYTGMRAGEIAQLQIDDFDFAGAIPVIRVREDGEPGTVPKQLKSPAATRDLPISPILVELGLQAFVAARSKGTGRPRVFPDISFGAGDRRSDGLTKFWGRHLRKYGLHKDGRATHVFRHTVAASMRRNRVPEEVIGWVLGHAAVSQTGDYGGKSPVEVMADAVAKIGYGFDVVSLLRDHEARLRREVDESPETALDQGCPAI